LRIPKKLHQAYRRNKVIYGASRTRDWLKYRYFRMKGAAEGRGFAEELSRTEESCFCFTIAFNTPWVIDALTKGWQRYSSGSLLVVVDNSNSVAARQSIEKICKIRGVPYFGLPANPERHRSRSNGIAMNWVYYNIVRHLKPKAFGFLDHDCLPIAPLNLAERLGHKTAYGVRHISASITEFTRPADDKRWFLWAGLCLFSYRDVEHLPLNFSEKRRFGLDTGGANWGPIYSRLPSEVFEFATESHLPIHLGEVDAKYEIFDEVLLHVGGASYAGPSGDIEYRCTFLEYVWTTYLGGVQDRIAMV
jgi:hypothetical protein